MIKIDDLFKPGSPINKKEMLVGRTRQLNHINKVLYSGGRAVVITGTRGIGKTSLANVASSLNGIQVKADCDTDSTFHSWGLHLLSELGVDAEIIEKTVEETLGASIGATLMASFGIKGSTKTTKKERGIGTVNITPNILLKILLKLSSECVITIDEFDRIPRNNKLTISLFGDFIKLLGNRASEHNIKLIFMGVSSSAQTLLNNHESIKRNVSSVHLSRLTQKSIKEYLEYINKVSIYKFTPEVINLMAVDFKGFPHWVHLVGRYSLLDIPKGGYITLKIYEENANEAIDEMLGIDSKFDLIRKEKAYAIDMVIDKIVNDYRMRPLYDDVIQSLKDKHRIDINDIKNALNTLKKNRVIAIHGNKFRLVDPEISPFLYVNLRKARHVSKEYKECRKAGKQLPLFCDIEENVS